MPTFSTFCNVVNVVRVSSEVEWVRAELVKALTAFMAINRDLEHILTVPPFEKQTSTQRTMFANCETVEWADQGLLITRTGTDHFFDLRNLIGHSLGHSCYGHGAGEVAL